MKYLCKTTEVYRVDSAKEAEALIDSAKKEKTFSLAKYSTEYKERKQKGEVIDAWYVVTLNKVFTDMKEPEEQFEVSYKLASAFEEDEEDAD